MTTSNQLEHVMSLRRKPVDQDGPSFCILILICYN